METYLNHFIFKKFIFNKFLKKINLRWVSNCFVFNEKNPCSKKLKYDNLLTMFIMMVLGDYTLFWNIGKY